MSSFTSPLVVSPMPDGRKWKLVSKFTYHIGSEFSRNYIKVPKGFVTDFASVPFVFWPIIPPWGRWGKASILHDYAYQSKCMSRLEADHLFIEAMTVLNVPAWKRIVMFLGVRLFGWLGYSKNNLGGTSGRTRN